MTEVPALEVVDVSKHFGDVVAVDHVSLSAANGEFVSLLGPSGCGKTTTMRMIAGFEEPTSGVIRLLGEDLNGYPPHLRNLNMVFQQYALFPHLNVFDNIGFELRVKHVSKAEITRRVGEMLEMVRLPNMEKRKPAQLSGGQRQRVALARSLINHPGLLLLDEPLGALDQKLRKEMQVELKRLQREVGITFLYVTHDQEEALTMSDRIAVMNAGRIIQADTPQAIYDAPATTFVAGFIGESNLMPGTWLDQDGSVGRAELSGSGVVATRPAEGVARGESVHLAVRPERMEIVTADRDAGNNRVDGTVRDLLFAGTDTRYFVTLRDGTEIVVREQNSGAGARAAAERGSTVGIAWRPDDTVVLSA
jgi:spermidine/putrescine transport system ATP-binding protein